MSKFQIHNYAANTHDSTHLVRAYLRENAVKYFKSTIPGLKDKDVYPYDGILSSAPIDETYDDPIMIPGERKPAERDVDGNWIDAKWVSDNRWVENIKVRFTDEYKHLEDQ